MRNQATLSVYLGAVSVIGAAVASANGAVITFDAVQNATGPGSTSVSTSSPGAGDANGGSGHTISTGTNDINTQGTQVVGVDYTGVTYNAWQFKTVINGQTFTPNTDAAVATHYSDTLTANYAWVTSGSPYADAPNAAELAYGSYTQPALSSGPPDFTPIPSHADYTLGTARYSNGTTAQINLSSLAIGRTYLIQIFAADARAGLGNVRFETLSSGTGSPTAVLHYQSNTGGVSGQYVIGRFVADAATQTISMAAGTTNASAGAAQVNLFQLRDITPAPEPATLSLLAVGALSLLARRRR